ncbi:MAG: winged helix-turn-helix domain-containing protein [Nitrososphaerota archaeon]|nr:winged helix-turn-helix domain-containing protein [Candidatus Bathyarchaeota archaeon]MDW8041124.1 winged helix-turn-helix domain-containing protein [Nitrososphaerota archaeon]
MKTVIVGLRKHHLKHAMLLFYDETVVERNLVEMNVWGSNPQQKRRDKLYIIAEILEIARDGVLKTQIMYRANLSFTQLNDYLKFMLKVNLVDRIVDNAKEIYKATPKGLEFLQRYREMTELLKTDDEDGRNNVKVPPAHLLKKNHA